MHRLKRHENQRNGPMVCPYSKVENKIEKTIAMFYITEMNI